MRCDGDGVDGGVSVKVKALEAEGEREQDRLKH